MELLGWIVLVLSFIKGVKADGQFAVLHTPPSVLFVGGVQVQDTVLENIFLVALGFTIHKTSSWTEMKLVNPFETPEAAVAFYVDGVSSVGTFNEDTKLYPLLMASYDPDIYKFVVKRISKLNETKCKLVNMKLSCEYDLRMHSHIFGEYTNYKLPKLNLRYLKYAVEQDYRFLRELQALKAITAAVKSGVIKADGIVDFYTFRFGSLDALADRYGENSKHVMEAKNLLNQQIRELNEAYVEAYDGSVLFTVIVTDVATIHRRRRHVTVAKRAREDTTDSTPRFRGDEDPPDATQSTNEPSGTGEGATTDITTTVKTTLKPRIINKYRKKETDAQEHDIAMYNIIFWTCNALFFAMINIVYALATMDPGRDSVVYRMTSAIDRVKMD